MKKVLSVVLCLIMMIGTVAIGESGFFEALNVISIKGSAKAKYLTDYNIGDIILFGSYPQTDVTESLGSILTPIATNWKSYNYYSGSGVKNDGQMTSSDYMQYCDITYCNCKYRGVTFSEYRPYFTGYTTSSSKSYQPQNGYFKDNTYWFKYEPLKWRVLDPEKGLLLSEDIIDCQPFNNYMNYVDYGFYGTPTKEYNANNYAKSSLRKWLTDETDRSSFINTAFSDVQQNKILYSSLDNRAREDKPEYDSESTNDKVYLLSYYDINNTAYGLSTKEERYAVGSDYAKCQGLYKSSYSYDNKKTSEWSLRTAVFYDYIFGIQVDGYINQTFYTEFVQGVRPAIKLSPSTMVSEYSDNEIQPLLQDNSLVMSYNVYVENGSVKGMTNGKTYDCRYETRARYIVNNIMEVVPDSVGFQEVTSEMRLFLENFEDLHGRIMASVYTFVGEYRGGKGHNEASFIAYRKDKFNLKDSGTRWLSDTGKKNSKYPTAGYNRVFTYALLENKNTKQQYLHINTHIDHDDEAAEYAAGQIIYFVNHAYPNTPVVLTGDFNHTKSAQMFKNLLDAGFVDTNVGNDTTKTYTNCYNQGKKEDGETQVYSAKTIDFILVRNSLENGIEHYNVCAEDYFDSSKYGNFALPYPYPSDHHPIVADLTLQYKETAITAETKYTTEKGHSSTNKVKYDSKWLGFDNKGYNHELAQFCADFAMMGYTGSKTELEENLGKFGFNNAEINLKTGQKIEGRDRVNYFIADKKELVNGEEYTVVFAGFIGSNGYQWYSNFDPYGTERQQSYAGSSEKDKVHLGFADARDFAIGLLQTHIGELGVDRSKVKLILTGHSRGAATANLIAAKILDGKAGLPVYGSNMYTYTFATPNVVNNNDSSVNTYAERYKCIFNIVNPEDFVTKVLLHDWGYGRYGITYTLPSKTNDSSNYSKYLSKIKNLFAQYDGGTYDPYKMGERRTYGVVSNMSKNVGSVNELYTNKFWYDLKGLVPRNKDPFTFFKNTLLNYLVKKDMGEIKKVALEGGPFYLGIIAFFAWPDIQMDSLHFTKIGYLVDAIEDITLGGKFTQAHQMETYCAHMNALTSSQLTEYRAAYKESFNCPVDVEVYDTDTDELVGRIVNNTVDEAIAAKENALVANAEGDSKEFWLPSNGNYRIVITGNDDGKMDYSVSEIDSDIGEVNRDNFFDVTVQDGVSMTADFSEEFTDLDNLVLTLSDGTELAPTERIADEAKEYQINVSVIGPGYATESTTAVSGDYVTLSAEGQNGAEFLGWYENDSLISTETDYSFVAKSDRDLTAKFEEIKPTSLRVSKMPSKTVYTFKKDTSLDLSGMELEVTYSNGSKKTITDTSLFKASGYSATPKGEKTITVEYEGLKTDFKVTVKYVWWQWLIMIFLFGWLWYAPVFG